MFPLTSLKNKFNRSYNLLLKEKPFLKDYQDFFLHHFIYSVHTQYISDKFSLIKEGPIKDYNKKLRRVFYIDDFSDKEYLEQVSRLRLRFILSMLSLMHNEDDINFLWKEYYNIKRENFSLKKENITQLDERNELISKIIKAKNDLIKSNNKVSQNKVAERLNIPPSSFRDKLKLHKIDFNNLK